MHQLLTGIRAAIQCYVCSCFLSISCNCRLTNGSNLQQCVLMISSVDVISLLQCGLMSCGLILLRTLLLRTNIAAPWLFTKDSFKKVFNKIYIWLCEWTITRRQHLPKPCFQLSRDKRSSLLLTIVITVVKESREY